MIARIAVLAGSLAVACATLVLVVFWLLQSHAGITKANFDRVALGMSRAQVQELFGGAANSTSPSGRAWREIQGIQGVRTPDGMVHEVWGGDDGAAIIQFNDEGIAVHTHWIQVPGAVRSTLSAIGL
jgi:hypothetical protein